MTRRRKTPVKDRILNARIPEELDRELREQAEKLDMPVSQLVRGILQRTVDLVGNLSGNVEHLVTEVVEDVAGFRDTVEAATCGGRHVILKQIVAWQPIRCNRPGRCWASGRDLSPGDEAWLGVREDGRPGPCVARDELDPLLEGWRIEENWTRIRVNREIHCADSGALLELGSHAWLEKGSRPPVIISDDAMTRRREGAADAAREEERHDEN